MHKRLAVIFLVLLISMFTVNKVFYLHVHKLNDGRLIVHAHPFNKSTDKDPIKHHHHSKSDYVIVAQIGLLFLVALSPLLLVFLNNCIVNVFCQRKTFSFDSKRKTYGRAPPVIG